MYIMNPKIMTLKWDHKRKTMEKRAWNQKRKEVKERFWKGKERESIQRKRRVNEKKKKREQKQEIKVTVWVQTTYLGRVSCSSFSTLVSAASICETILQEMKSTMKKQHIVFFSHRKGIVLDKRDLAKHVVLSLENVGGECGMIADDSSNKMAGSILAGPSGTDKRSLVLGISQELNSKAPFFWVVGSKVYFTEIKKTERQKCW